MNTTLKSPTESLPMVLVRILMYLAGMQLVRAVLYWIIGKLGQITGLFEPTGDITNGLSILITGLIIWSLVRPKRETLGLTDLSRSKGKYIYLAVLLLLVMLAGYNLVINPSQIMPTILSCLVFPLFEEPIFRGWIWNQVSPVIPAKRNGIFTTVLVSALFAVWHLGYWDVVSLHMKAGTSTAVIIHIMLMKMVIAAIIGIFTGIFRWKTGNIYASILFHAAWNLFGR
jgi:membrane protease YdiL (CAAX protease family)